MITGCFYPHQYVCGRGRVITPIHYQKKLKNPDIAFPYLNVLLLYFLRFQREIRSQSRAHELKRLCLIESELRLIVSEC